MKLVTIFTVPVVAFLLELKTQMCLENVILREGRASIYPPFTVLQFSIGLAVPAQVPNRSVFMNFGILNNVPLPSQINQFYSPKRQNRMIPILTRQDFYEMFKKVVPQWNINGNKMANEGNVELISGSLDCVLRTICQISAFQNSISQRSELVFKILLLLFLPSQNYLSSIDRSYFEAEEQGFRSAGVDRFENCTAAYPSCRISPLELLFHFPKKKNGNVKLHVNNGSSI